MASKTRRGRAATLPDAPKSGMQELTNHFMSHLSNINGDLALDIPPDFLHLIIQALTKLHSCGASNLLYLLSQALLQSTHDKEDFGPESLAFKVLQLMLVSLMDTEENQASLLNSCDQVVAWIFDGLADSERFVEHVNNLLFPSKNLKYRYAPISGEDEKVLSVIRTKDSSVQCQYVNVTVDTVSKEEVHEVHEEVEDVTLGFDVTGQIYEKIVGHATGVSDARMEEDGDDDHVEELEQTSVEGSDVKSNVPSIEVKNVPTDLVQGSDDKSRLKAVLPEFSLLNIPESKQNSTDSKFVLEKKIKTEKSILGPRKKSPSKTKKKQTEDNQVENQDVASKKKKVRCKECGKYVVSLHDHMPVHNRVPKHKCPVCDQLFLYRGQRKNHLAKMHPGVTQQELRVKEETTTNICKICGKKFVNFYSMQRHKREFHKLSAQNKSLDDTELGDIVTDHTCTICGHLCISEEALKLHQERNICKTCGLCDMVFPTKLDLVDHKGKAHNVGDGTCGLCDWKAKSLPSLNNVKGEPNSTHSVKEEGKERTQTPHNEEKSIPDVKEEPLKKGPKAPPRIGGKLGMKLRRHFREVQCLACLQCSVVFPSKQALDQHRDEQHKSKAGKSGKCDICNRRFYSAYYLECHMKDVHQKATDSSTAKPETAQLHESIDENVELPQSEHLLEGAPAGSTPETPAPAAPSNGENSEELQSQPFHEADEPVTPPAPSIYTCEHCQKEFTNPRKLGRHQRVAHWRAVTGGHLCGVCGMRFRCQQDLRDHENIHAGKKPFRCELCDRDLHTRSSYRSHQWRHRQRDTAALCDVCGEEFPDGLKMLYHKKTYHSKARVPYKCRWCDKQFLSRPQMYQHFKIYHSTEMKKFPCQTCGKTFSQKGHLLDHMSTHNKTKRFFCDKCGEGFVHRLPYKRHVIKHIGTKLFACPVCNKKFDAMDYLQRHVKTMHQNMTVKLPKYKNPGSKLADEFRIMPIGQKTRENPREVALPSMGGITVEVVGPKESQMSLEEMEGVNEAVYVVKAEKGEEEVTAHSAVIMDTSSVPGMVLYEDGGMMDAGGHTVVTSAGEPVIVDKNGHLIHDVVIDTSQNTQNVMLSSDVVKQQAEAVVNDGSIASIGGTFVQGSGTWMRVDESLVQSGGTLVQGGHDNMVQGRETLVQGGGNLVQDGTVVQSGENMVAGNSNMVIIQGVDGQDQVIYLPPGATQLQVGASVIDIASLQQ